MQVLGFCRITPLRNLGDLTSAIEGPHFRGFWAPHDPGSTKLQLGICKLEAMAAHNVLKTLYPDSSNFVLKVTYLQCCMTSSRRGHR